MRSRFTDFLTTDGEKSDRYRDQEFEIIPATTRADLTKWWDEGWDRVFSAIDALKPDDVMRQVTIRGEPHTVLPVSYTHLDVYKRQLLHLSREHTPDHRPALTQNIQHGRENSCPGRPHRSGGEENPVRNSGRSAAAAAEAGILAQVETQKEIDVYKRQRNTSRADRNSEVGRAEATVRDPWVMLKAVLSVP